MMVVARYSGALPALLSLALLAGAAPWPIAGAPPAAAEPADASEKSAFDTAKELGTADAWNAFLKAYPEGFHADMARAYLKKLGDASPPAAAPPAAPDAATPAIVPSSARVGERDCSERKKLRSQHSKEPTKITFVNKSGMYRAIMWIDFNGDLQDYGGVNDGDQVTFDTFRTHPWMITTGPGDCLQIFLPAAEPGSVDLLRLAADDGPAKSEKPKKRSEEKKPLKCAENYKLQKGECVLLQNCGKNAYRSPEGDCYCTKGYKMVDGKCVWPQDKQGFEKEPWKKGGCKGLQAQCSQGNAGACQKYETTCQVN